MSGHQRTRRSEDWEQAATWPTHHDRQERAARQRTLDLDRALRRRSRDLERGDTASIPVTGPDLSMPAAQIDPEALSA